MPIYEQEDFDKMNNPQNQSLDRKEAQEKRRRITSREKSESEEFQRWMEESWNL